MPRRPTSKSLARKRAIENGYRSGLEERVAKELTEAGVDFKYEDPASVIRYQKPESKYLPDILLPNGIIVELKGRFLGSDRTKHLLIKKQHPDIDIRFVFQNPNAKLSKSSKTTYSAWCDQKGFKWAKKSIPPEWLQEEPKT